MGPPPTLKRSFTSSSASAFAAKNFSGGEGVALLLKLRADDKSDWPGVCAPSAQCAAHRVAAAQRQHSHPARRRAAAPAPRAATLFAWEGRSISWGPLIVYSCCVVAIVAPLCLLVNWDKKPTQLDTLIELKTPMSARCRLRRGEGRRKRSCRSDRRRQAHCSNHQRLPPGARRAPPVGHVLQLKAVFYALLG
jgi:hypothetical protein